MYAGRGFSVVFKLAGSVRNVCGFIGGGFSGLWSRFGSDLAMYILNQIGSIWRNDRDSRLCLRGKVWRFEEIERVEALAIFWFYRDKSRIQMMTNLAAFGGLLGAFFIEREVGLI